MKNSKISIIGGGFVGSTCAHWILNRNLGDIVLLDINESSAQGKALDLLQSSSLTSASARIVGTADYKHIEGSDVVIITAGRPRQDGMSRDELRQINADVLKQVCKKVKIHCPDSYVIIVTNPLDVMTYLAFKVLGFPPERVMGMAGVLDSARFKTFVAETLNVSTQDVQAFVLGGHGDTMVLIPRLCHVGGIPLTELLPEQKIADLIARAQKGGAEIVSLLKSSSAYYAPALSAVEMAEAILQDKKRILPCSAYLTGQYGVQDLYMGVLCRIGAGGIEQIMELKLTQKENQQFQKSVAAVRRQVEQLN